MREIKFRAWDGERMFIPNAIPNPFTNSAHSGGSLMQFTGLYDRNDKEVYEGDILESIGEPDVDGKWEVVFIDGRFCAQTETNLVGLHYWTSCEIEVIGNICQNGTVKEAWVEEETCTECGEPTGKSGKGEDSFYIVPEHGKYELGPLCEECYDRIAWGGESLWQPLKNI